MPGHAAPHEIHLRRDLPDNTAAIGAAGKPRCNAAVKRCAVHIAIRVQSRAANRIGTIGAEMASKVMEVGIGPAAAAWCQLEPRAVPEGTMRGDCTVKIPCGIHSEITLGSARSVTPTIQQRKGPTSSRGRQLEHRRVTVGSGSACGCAIEIA